MDEPDLPKWMSTSARPEGMDEETASWGLPVLNVSVALEALGPSLNDVVQMATAVVETLERVCVHAPNDVERGLWEEAFGLPGLQDTLRAYALLFSIAAGDVGVNDVGSTWRMAAGGPRTP